MMESVSQMDSKTTACCRFMQPIGKKTCISHGWQQEPIGKELALDSFVNSIYATPAVYLFHQLFYFFILFPASTQKVSSH